MADAALPALLSLLQDSDNPLSRTESARAINNLAASADFTTPTAGTAASSVVNHDRPALHELCTPVSLPMDTKSECLYTEPILPALLSLVQDPTNAEGRARAAQAIGSLACKPELRDRIAGMPALRVPPLLQAAISSNWKQAWSV